MSVDFRTSATNLGGGVAMITVVGEADLHTAPQLQEALADTLEGGSRRVLVDLSGATFIDSTTLGVLMGAVRRLRPLEGEVAIVCRDPNIRRIFEITLLDRVFRICESPDAGIRYLRRAARHTGQPVS